MAHKPILKGDPFEKQKAGKDDTDKEKAGWQNEIITKCICCNICETPKLDFLYFMGFFFFLGNKGINHSFSHISHPSVTASAGKQTSNILKKTSNKSVLQAKRGKKKK